MKITIRTVLLTLILLGGYLIGQSQTAKIEQHGWKVVHMSYDKNEEPSTATFVKDYPVQATKEYPKVLVMYLTTESPRTDGRRMSLRKVLDEFDCRRGLGRTVRWFWADGKEEDRRKPNELNNWEEVLRDTSTEAVYRYACRPRTSPKQ